MCFLELLTFGQGSGIAIGNLRFQGTGQISTLSSKATGDILNHQVFIYLITIASFYHESNEGESAFFSQTCLETRT